MSVNKAIAAFLLLMAGHHFAGAQLVVDTNETPYYLVHNVLLSNSIVAYNIKYTGAHRAIAYFDGTNSNIGLSNGILMTNGSAEIAIGPNNPKNRGVDNGLPGDTALTRICGDSTFDASILEFDFVPYADTVSFDFVFGSEEYPEFTCCKVNDVFAFFISGPGITGEENIALVPHTTIPISINTLNGNCYKTSECGGGCCGSNSEYYIDNTGGTTVEYTGFTTVMKAFATVQCGKEYHIRIAIADGGDPWYDSGVFLGGGSFRGGTNPIQITSNPVDSICPYSQVSLLFPDYDTTHHFSWSFDGGSVVSGMGKGPYVVTWPSSGIKQVRVSVSGPCAYDIDSLNVDVTGCDVQAPNVITPASGDRNSEFFVRGLDKYQYTNLEIYNRWGVQVYYDPNYQNNWNGGNLPDGTYFFLLTLENGNVKKGFVTIIR